MSSIKYLQGISWFILSIILSNVNDILMKYLGTNLHPIQVAFFRFFFGTLCLLPFMLYFGKSSFQTSRPLLHFARGTILFFGISIWCFGLSIVPISTATLLTFTIPMFVLILAPIFLQELVTWKLWVATIVGFLGVYLVLHPSAADFHPMSFVMLVSALLFASLDILNKKFVIKETMLGMLFYSALVTFLWSIYPATLFWKEVAINDLILLFVLGASGNLILFCLLKCFSFVNASAVAPYRYLELALSIVAGYLLFLEIPTTNMVIGALIIIPSTLVITYSQLNKQAGDHLKLKRKKG